MSTITKLEELEIWQMARRYAKEINRMVTARSFDPEPGLKQQMKNASGSIMDNIAEGFGRGSKNEFVNFLTIAKGSAEESRSQLSRCIDCGLIDQHQHTDLSGCVDMLVRKIGALIHYLNQVPIKGQKYKGRL
ncbi:MAG: four helix bundle protein [Bacteroidota bacterium]|nr:four helix bundle protein [Bacteroidota bacterium]